MAKQTCLTVAQTVTVTRADGEVESFVGRIVQVFARPTAPAGVICIQYRPGKPERHRFLANVARIEQREAQYVTVTHE